jgi:hypothetical protein
MKIIHQDMLEIQTGILCHQVNCQGVMGSGIAKSIANKWPKVNERYKECCKQSSSALLLGDSQVVQINDSLFVANVFGQNFYGTKNGPATDYLAVGRAFESLKQIIKDINHWETYHNLPNLPVYVPYKMGCGLGGGNWDTYLEIIIKYFPDVIVCQLMKN